MIQKDKYKEIMATYYKLQVKNTQFWVGDLVLHNNEASWVDNVNKYEARWEGPYRVVEVLPKGSYKLAYSNGQIFPRTWHVTNLRMYCV